MAAGFACGLICRETTSVVGPVFPYYWTPDDFARSDLESLDTCCIQETFCTASYVRYVRSIKVAHLKVSIVSTAILERPLLAFWDFDHPRPLISQDHLFLLRRRSRCVLNWFVCFGRPADIVVPADDVEGYTE